MDNYKKLIPENKYYFSASQYFKFWSNPKDFFRRVLLKEEKDTSTSKTVLGTCIHKVIENCFNNFDANPVPSCFQEVFDYVQSLGNPDIDKYWVMEKFQQMQSFVEHTCMQDDLNKPDCIEQSFIHQLSENVYLTGTIDYYSSWNSKLLDFKTTSARIPIELEQSYLSQLLLYKLLLENNTKNKVDYIGNIYYKVPELNRISEKTGKAMKDYPVEVHKLIFPVSKYDEQEKILQANLEVIANTIEYILANPDTLYMFAKDFTLKGEKWQLKS